MTLSIIFIINGKKESLKHGTLGHFRSQAEKFLHVPDDVGYAIYTSFETNIHLKSCCGFISKDKGQKNKYRPPMHFSQNDQKCFYKFWVEINYKTSPLSFSIFDALVLKN